MNRRLIALALTALTIFAIGCRDKSLSVPDTPVSSPRGAHALVAADLVGNTQLQPRPDRFIAEHDSLTVTIPASKLQQVWESTVAFCATIQCEVVSSNLRAQTSESTPSATVSMRIAPAALRDLMNHLQRSGKIVQHATNREDETDRVIDTDARIKNLTAFRDNLRAMLAKSNVTVANLIQIDQQLTDTQSDLDSETAQRKVLADQTEKIAVDVAFGIERNTPSGAFASVWSALVYVGDILGESVVTLMTVILFLIPWATAFFLIVWLVVRARRKSHRPSYPPSPVST